MGGKKVVVVHAMIACNDLVYHMDGLVLLDLGSTYYYELSYLASCLDMLLDSLDIYIHVSRPICDSIMVDLVYQPCVITIWGYEIRVDLMLLNMVDFKVITLHGLYISISW